MKKSKLLELSKKYKILNKFYYFYNIYIRNYKFLTNSSQFGEDKFLLNLFDKGFKGKYLDLGCFHPTRHSNTNLLYKNKWNGINIDLNPLSIELFNYMRPKDINLNIGISSEETEKDLYFIDEFNTQNTLDKNQLNFLKNHHKIQENEIIKKKIKTKKISTILNDYKFTKINFFNIDIEGHELEVIKTINFEKIKIQYLCLEMIDHNNLAIEYSNKIRDILKKNDFDMIKKFGFNYIYKNKYFNYD